MGEIIGSDPDELAVRFTYHAPKNDQVERYNRIREFGIDFAFYISAYCPDCRELSLALTKIEEAVMWANAAIARRE